LLAARTGPGAGLERRAFYEEKINFYASFTPIFTVRPLMPALCPPLPVRADYCRAHTGMATRSNAIHCVVIFDEKQARDIQRGCRPDGR
jgi:hypothetical protein